MCSSLLASIKNDDVEQFKTCATNFKDDDWFELKIEFNGEQDFDVEIMTHLSDIGNMKFLESQSVFSCILIYGSRSIFDWLMQTYQEDQKFKNLFFKRIALHTLVDAARYCVSTQAYYAEFYRHVRHHPLIQSALRIADEGLKLEPLEYAVLYQQFTLAISFLHTEGVYCEIIQTGSICRVLQYDFSMYANGNANNRCEYSPLLIAVNQYFMSGARAEHVAANQSDFAKFVGDPAVRLWLNSDKEIFFGWQMVIKVMILGSVSIVSFISSALASYLLIYTNFSKEKRFTGYLANNSQCQAFESSFFVQVDLFKTVNWISTFFLFLLLIPQLILKSLLLHTLWKFHRICSFTRNQNIDFMFYSYTLSYFVALFALAQIIIDYSQMVDISSTTEKSSILLTVFDVFVLQRLITTLWFMIFNIRPVSQFCYTLCDSIRYHFFITTVMFIIISLFAFWFLFLLPCEPKIYDSNENFLQCYFNAAYYFSRLLIGFKDFNLESYDRLQFVHILSVLYILYFFANFLIALMSEQVSAIGNHFDYHFEMQTFHVLQEYHFAYEKMTQFWSFVRRRVFKLPRNKKFQMENEVKFVILELN